MNEKPEYNHRQRGWQEKIKSIRSIGFNAESKFLTVQRHAQGQVKDVTVDIS